MLNELSHDVYSLMINVGSVCVLTMGLGIMISLVLGTPVKTSFVPVRRKR